MFLSDTDKSREEDSDANDLQDSSLAHEISTLDGDKGRMQQKQTQAQTLTPSHGEDLALLRMLGLGNSAASDSQDQYLASLGLNPETIEPNLVSFPLSTEETQKTMPGSMPPIQGEYSAAMTAWGVRRGYSQREPLCELLDLLDGDTTAADITAALRTKRRRNSLDSKNVQDQPAISVANVVGQLHKSRQYQESSIANQSLFQSVVGLQSASEIGSFFPKTAGTRGTPVAPPFLQNVMTASQGGQSQCLSLPTEGVQAGKATSPQEEAPGLKRFSGLHTATSIQQWQQVDGQTRSQWEINSDKSTAGGPCETHLNGWIPLDDGSNCFQGQSFRKVESVHPSAHQHSLHEQETAVMPILQAQDSMMQLVESHMPQKQLDDAQENVGMQRSREEERQSLLPSISNLIGEESYDSMMKSGIVQFQDQFSSLADPGEATQAPGMFPYVSTGRDFPVGNPNLPMFPSRAESRPSSEIWRQVGVADGGFPSKGNHVGAETACSCTTSTSILSGLGGVTRPHMSIPPVDADTAVSYTGSASRSSDRGNVPSTAVDLLQQLPRPTLLATRPGKGRSISDPALSSSSAVGGSSDPSLTRSKSVPPAGSRTDIKRPRSAYNFFYRSERTRLLNERGQSKPKVSLEVMTKTIAYRWKSLTSEQRAPFKRLASSDKERYERELKEFNIQQKRRLEVLRKESSSP